MRVRRAAPVLVLLVSLAAACGGGAQPDEAAPSEAATTQPGTRMEKGFPWPLPERAESSEDVNAVYEVGQEVFITDDGLKPKSLTAKMLAEVWFINETDEQHEIEFTNVDGESVEPVPAGDHSVWKPERTGAYVYRLKGDPQTTGDIQVETYFDPGETPDPGGESPAP